MVTENKEMVRTLSPEQRRLVSIVTAQLDKIPEFAQLRLLNELVVSYGGEAVWIGPPVATAVVAPEATARSRVSEGQTATFASGSYRMATQIAAGTVPVRQFGYGQKTKAVQEAAVAFLEERGYRASSADFLPVMEAAGIEMGGKNPTRTVASFLSTLPRFNNVKPHGYGLVEWGQGPGPRGEQMRELLGETADLGPGLDQENAPRTGFAGGGAETGDATPVENGKPETASR